MGCTIDDEQEEFQLGNRKTNWESVILSFSEVEVLLWPFTILLMSGHFFSDDEEGLELWDVRPHSFGTRAEALPGLELWDV